MCMGVELDGMLADGPRGVAWVYLCVGVILVDNVLGQQP